MIRTNKGAFGTVNPYRIISLYCIVVKRGQKIKSAGSLIAGTF